MGIKNPKPTSLQRLTQAKTKISESSQREMRISRITGEWTSEI